MRPLLMLAAVLLVSGCTSAQVQDVAVKTAENVARAACFAARNCTNTCPDGSVGTPTTYSCPGRP